MKYFMIIAVLLTLLLSACAPQAVPTVDPAQAQASAVAAASTITALTQAAVPTAAPTLDVSLTPLPTPTPLANPTTSDQPTQASSSDISQATIPTDVPTTSGVTNCLHPLDKASAGKLHDTLIRNNTSGSINISLTLYKPNVYGQCGSISYGNMSRNSSVMAELPAGYWTAYAWAALKGKNITLHHSFFIQPAVFDKIELCIRDTIIVYKPAC